MLRGVFELMFSSIHVKPSQVCPCHFEGWSEVGSRRPQCTLECEGRGSSGKRWLSHWLEGRSPLRKAGSLVLASRQWPVLRPAGLLLCGLSTSWHWPGSSDEPGCLVSFPLGKNWGKLTGPQIRRQSCYFSHSSWQVLPRISLGCLNIMGR